MATTANLAYVAPAALQHGEYTVEDRVVYFACTRCRNVDTLNGYAIAPDGKVTPPWACPIRGCAAACWLILNDFQ